MARYRVTDPKGRTISFDWDQPEMPNDDDLDAIFAEADKQPISTAVSHAVTPPDPLQKPERPYMDTLGEAAKAGLKEGGAFVPKIAQNVNKGLAYGAKALTGSGGVFDDLVAAGDQTLAYLHPSERERESVNRDLLHKITGAFAAAPGQIGAFAMGSAIAGPVVGMGAVSALHAADQGPEAALKAGVEGAIAGKALSVLHPLSRGKRMIGGAGVGAAQGGFHAAQGEGDISDVITSAVTMAGLAYPGKKTGLTFKEVFKATPKEKRGEFGKAAKDEAARKGVSVDELITEAERRSASEPSAEPLRNPPIENTITGDVELGKVDGVRTAMERMRAAEGDIKEALPNEKIQAATEAIGSTNKAETTIREGQNQPNVLEPVKEPPFSIHEAEPYAKEMAGSSPVDRLTTMRPVVALARELLSAAQNNTGRPNKTGYREFNNGDGWEREYKGNGNPEWFKEWSKAHKGSRGEIEVLMKKVDAGKPLTEKQTAKLDPLLDALEQWRDTTPEIQAELSRRAFEREGFQPVRSVVGGNLKLGDEMIRNGERFKVMGENKDGTLSVQDGELLKVDVFDTLPVEGFKPAADTFQLTPSVERPVPVLPERAPSLFANEPIPPELMSKKLQGNGLANGEIALERRMSEVESAKREDEAQSRQRSILDNESGSIELGIPSREEIGRMIGRGVDAVKAAKAEMDIQRAIRGVVDGIGMLAPDSWKRAGTNALLKPPLFREGIERDVFDLQGKRTALRERMNNGLVRGAPERGYLGAETLARLQKGMKRSEVDLLDEIIDKGDRNRVNFSPEQLASVRGITPAIIEAYQAARQMYRESIETRRDGERMAVKVALGDNARADKLISMADAILAEPLSRDAVMASLKPHNQKALARVIEVIDKIEMNAEELRRRPGYAPRTRPEGDWHVRVIVKEADATNEPVTVYFNTAMTEAGAKLLRYKINKNQKKYLGENYDPNLDYEVAVTRSGNILEDVWAQAGTPHGRAAVVNKALADALKNGSITEDQALAVAEGLVGQMNDTQQTRGFGRHFKQRAFHTIEGYERGKPAQQALRYAGGLAGYYSKAIFSMRAARAMQGQPQHLLPPAVKYVQKMLQNSTAADQAVGTVRQVATLTMLGYKALLLAQQAGQQFTHGIPEAGRFLRLRKGQSADVLFAKVAKDLMTGKLTPEETAMMERFHAEGGDLAQYSREVTGLTEGGGVRALNETTRLGMFPFSNMETYVNRIPAFVAGVRIFSGEHVTAKDYYPRQAFRTHAEYVYANAKRMVEFAHGVMDKSNEPAWIQKTGAVGKLAYTFGSIQTHMFHWTLSRLFKHGELAPVVRSLATMTALYGAASGVLPGMNTVEALMNKQWGTSWKLRLRKWLKQRAEETGDVGKAIADVVYHGVPGLFGVSMSSSGQANLPLPLQVASDVALGNKDFGESAFGVASGLVKKVSGGMGAYERGDTRRMTESLLPQGMVPPYRAYSLHNEPMRDKGGNIVYDNNNAPLQLTSDEAWKYGVTGMQPTRMLDAQDRQHYAHVLPKAWNERKQKLAALKAYKGETDEWRAKAEIFNRELSESEAAELVKPIELTPPVRRRPPTHRRKAPRPEGLSPRERMFAEEQY